MWFDLYYMRWWSEGLMFVGILSILTASVMLMVPCIMGFLQRDFIYGRNYAKMCIWSIVLYSVTNYFLIPSLISPSFPLYTFLIGPILMLASCILFMAREIKGRRF